MRVWRRPAITITYNNLKVSRGYYWRYPGMDALEKVFPFDILLILPFKRFGKSYHTSLSPEVEHILAKVEAILFRETSNGHKPKAVCFTKPWWNSESGTGAVCHAMQIPLWMRQPPVISWVNWRSTGRCEGWFPRPVRNIRRCWPVHNLTGVVAPTTCSGSS